MSIIYAFIKLFESEKHANAFMDGNLYMNTISYFKEYADAGEMRGDEYEGIAGIFQPGKIDTVKFGDLEIPGSDLSGPILVHDANLLKRNAFCLYSINSGNYDEIPLAAIDEFRDSLKVHEKFFGLGKFCVIVNRTSDFLDRCKAAIEANNYSGELSLVKYYDDNEIHGYLDSRYRGFQKRKIFMHQKEYRIIIDKQCDSPKPMMLNIGSLRDTTILTSTDNFNDQLKVSLPD